MSTSNVQLLLAEWRELIQEKQEETFSSFELIEVNERVAEVLLDTLNELETDLDWRNSNDRYGGSPSPTGRSGL